MKRLTRADGKKLYALLEMQNVQSERERGVLREIAEQFKE